MAEALTIVPGQRRACVASASQNQPHGLGHSRNVRPRAAIGRMGLRAAQRRPGAVPVKSASRRTATAALRTAAMTRADVPARSRWASSRMAASRTWCRALMSQWLRAAVAMTWGVPPRLTVRLVMPSAATAERSSPVCGSRTVRSIKNACASAGLVASARAICSQLWPLARASWTCCGSSRSAWSMRLAIRAMRVPGPTAEKPTDMPGAVGPGSSMVSGS
jgi:hypothetical protein